jgi:hypothetical protein
MGGSVEDKDDFKEFGPKHMFKEGADSEIVIDWYV